jgi:hypothetical protein
MTGISDDSYLAIADDQTKEETQARITELKNLDKFDK